MGIFTNSDKDKQLAEKTAAEQTSYSGALTSQLPDFATMDQRVHEVVDKFLDPKFLDPRGIFKSWGLGDLDTWDYFIDSFQKGRGVAGLKAYPVPSPSQYEQCKEQKGLAVWDENGWWRCFLPRAVLTRPGELSKEDVEGDKENKLGVYFKDINSLMEWKLHVQKLIREREEQEKIKRQTENLDQIYTDYEKDVDWYGTKENGLMSTSKSVHFQTLPNGDGEEITEIKNVYRDGKTENKRIKKLIPRDGSAPVIEDISGQKPSNLLKWVWNDEKKN